MSDIIKLDPNPSNKCFGCGGANDAGMKLAFEQDNVKQRITGRFVLGERYQGGGGGMMHGGIIALILDEVMGKVSRFTGATAVTAEMTINYLKPIRVDREIIVEGWHEEQKGRNLFHAGEIRDADGVVLARGRARFVVIDREKYAADLKKEPVVR